MRLDRNDPFEVYRRARIWGYGLTWDVVQVLVQTVANAEDGRPITSAPVYLTRRDHRRSAALLARGLLTLKGLPDSAVPLLLLVLFGKPRSDPIVDVEDAPEFEVGSEWIDPELLRTADGRDVFARVWTADGLGIRLAYLAEGRGGRSVIDQGLQLSASMRQRLLPRLQRAAA